MINAIKRIYIYLKEMYPLNHAVVGPLLCLVMYCGFSTLEEKLFKWNMNFFISSISVTLFILMIRIMDEFKDYEDDKINFPGRPLPSGRVFKNDLKILIFAIYSMLIFFNAAFPLMMLGTLMIFGYSFFMYKWFFIEKKMRKNLPLAFISHHPIILFYYLYIVLSWMTQHQLTLEFFPLDTVFIFLPLLLVFTCWELSRKIKKPSEENQYTTYSKIFGMKESIVLCLLCLIGAFLAPFVFLIKMNLPLYIIMIMICVFLLNLFPFVQFLDSKNKNIILKKETEKMVFILFLPIILVSWLYHFYPSLSWWL